MDLTEAFPCGERGKFPYASHYNQRVQRCARDAGPFFRKVLWRIFILRVGVLLTDIMDLVASAVDRIVQHDFTLGPWFPEGVVDVAYTVEFLEHVDIKYLDNVMALLKSARYVIMAASKQGGWSHVNVHFK